MQLTYICTIVLFCIVTLHAVPLHRALDGKTCVLEIHNIEDVSGNHGDKRGDIDNHVRSLLGSARVERDMPPTRRQQKMENRETRDYLGIILGPSATNQQYPSFDHANYQESESSEEEEDYDEKYDDGYADGYFDGYNVGFHAADYDDYLDAYYEGYIDGYSDGYYDYIADCEGDSSPEDSANCDEETRVRKVRSEKPKDKDKQPPTK